MTHINHRRKNRKPPSRRHPGRAYHNGYGSLETLPKEDHVLLPPPSEVTRGSDFLDKSLHGWERVSILADQSIGAAISNDFSKGHRGMARAVRGAKKFVRSRIRFHEKRAVQRMARQPENE